MRDFENIQYSTWSGTTEKKKVNSMAIIVVSHHRVETKTRKIREFVQESKKLRHKSSLSPLNPAPDPGRNELSHPL
jgi:hypothetical protein